MNNGNRELRKHFVDSLYNTLEGVISPTPYMEITDGDTVDVKFLNGKGRLPSKNSTEVTVLDLDTASLFFDDFHLLYEGETGVGKTYTSDALFGAIFGADGHHTVRLSGGVLGGSVLDPFTTTTLENGLPKTVIDPEKCAHYGAIFIDEINRGDPNEVFQVVDGVIHDSSGNRGYLRVPIPGTDRFKKLAIISAMNPADAQHNAATSLDIAGENRFLKFRFPNGVSEAASSQLEKRLEEGLHEKFWDEFRTRSGIKDASWKETYPMITDSSQFDEVLDGGSREFIDTAIGYIGYDPKETFDRNMELIRQGGVEPNFKIDENSNDYQLIKQSQGTLKHGFVRRDLRKIKDLSKLVGFIKGIKDGSYDASVSLNDVAASMGIILESKTATNTDHGALMGLVNDARVGYTGLRKSVNNLPENMGIRQYILDGAINSGNSHSFDGFKNSLDKGISFINSQAKNISDSTLRSRVLSDLIVLSHFTQAYKTDVEHALKQGGQDTLDGLTELYQNKKSTASVYEHRLDSILGGE